MAFDSVVLDSSSLRLTLYPPRWKMFAETYAQQYGVTRTAGDRYRDVGRAVLD